MLRGDEQLGVSRHTDAGLLTILYQDENYKEVGLEVYTGSKQDAGDGEW
jgi:isopenicillin N synthase-like dioxygenase